MNSILAQKLSLPCGAELPNRIAKSAMSEQLGDSHNNPTQDLITLYQRWSQGGAGLLITGNVMVDRMALGEPRNVVIEDERDLLTLKRWAAARQSNGSKIYVQINHPGRQSPSFLSRQPVAPSAIPVKLGKGVFAIPRALLANEIEVLIKRYAQTAAIVQKAGFDGVQIHGAHGYLVSQFLSPLANQRDDDWGGTPEKRRRFLQEIVRQIRKAVGKNFPIGVKLNSADFQRGGFTEEESMNVVQMLAAEGLDLLEISGGTYESAAMVGQAKQQESTKAREAYFLEYAQKGRKLVKLPLMLTGGLRSAQTMYQIVADGHVDIVGLARPLAIDPALPNKILADQSVRAESAKHSIGVKLLDSYIELAWYNQQIQRMGAGKDPDIHRSAWRTLFASIWGNGLDSLRLKRS